MKLKIRYENEIQIIELDAEATAGLWVSLSLEEDETLSQNEKEQKLQEAFDVQFNRPDYNNWHRHNRKDKFDPDPRPVRLDGKHGKLSDFDQDGSFDPLESLCIASDEEALFEKFEYEDLCRWIREVLYKKPGWADMFISICMDGEPVREYAARKGVSENSISQKLRRAKTKLADAWKKRQI